MTQSSDRFFVILLFILFALAAHFIGVELGEAKRENEIVHANKIIQACNQIIYGDK